MTLKGGKATTASTCLAGTGRESEGAREVRGGEGCWNLANHKVVGARTQHRRGPPPSHQHSSTRMANPLVMVGVSIIVGVAMAADPTVQTTYGPIVGATRRGVNIFHSVPFAEKPVRLRHCREVCVGRESDESVTMCVYVCVRVRVRVSVDARLFSLCYISSYPCSSYAFIPFLSLSHIQSHCNIPWATWYSQHLLCRAPIEQCHQCVIVLTGCHCLSGRIPIGLM